MRRDCLFEIIVLCLCGFAVAACHRTSRPADDDTESGDTDSAERRNDSASDVAFGSDDSDSEEATSTGSGTDAPFVETDTPSGPESEADTATETGTKSDVAPVPAVDQVAQGTFPVLTDSWDVSLLQSLNCLLWIFDGDSGELEINILNQVATSTTLTWQIASETDGNITTFVIYKDDPECSENSGHVYNWRILSSDLGVSMNSDGAFEVAIRNCRSEEFEIWRSDIISLAGAARGSSCKYISFGFAEFAVDGCGTRDGQCRTPESEDENPTCQAGTPICDTPLTCVDNRCLQQCDSDTDCGETDVYRCESGVCALF